MSPSTHPGDHIDRALSILAFVTLMVGGYNGEIDLNDREQQGFAQVLEHVTDELEQAMKGL
jgi:hypothetical protein